MDCAWSLPDHFQGISSVPPTDLMHGWFLKKEGWVGWPIYHHVPRSLQLYMAHALEWRFVKSPSNQMGTLPCIFAEGVPIMQQIMIFMTHKHSWSPGCCSETHDVERTLERNKIQPCYHNHDNNNNINSHQPTSKHSTNKLTWKPIFILYKGSFVDLILCELFDPVFWEFKITASIWSLHLITITLTSTRPDDAKLECSSVGVYVGGNSVGWVWGGSFQRRWGRVKSSGSSLRYG